MGNLQKYRIVFQGLSEGVHEFDFDVDDAFFEKLDYSEIKKGDLKVNVVLLKKSTFLELDFDITGFVELVCDRCLDEFKQKIKYKGKLFVKFSEADEDLAEDVIILMPGEHELDISHYIYESISLSIPLKRVHPRDKKGNPTCDPEMLNRLKNYIIDEPAEKNVDSRWDDLKNLMANNNN